MKRIIIVLLLILFTILIIPINTYAYSQSQLDVPINDLNNHSLREVFEDTFLLQASQLVTNGDFSDGTTWSVGNGNTLLSIEDTYLKALSVIDSNFDVSTIFNISYTLNEKIYIYSEVKGNNTKTFGIRGNLGGSIFTNLTTTLTNDFQVLSAVRTVNLTTSSQLRFYISGASVSDYVLLKQIYLFNISTLIANKQYSPLYSTTFDLMSDANIKTQMDDWVLRPWLALDFNSLGWFPTHQELLNWLSVYQYNKEHEIIVTDDGLGTDIMNLLKGFTDTIISLFNYLMYTEVTILGIRFSFLALIGSGLIIAILAFQIIWLVI